MQNYLLKFSRQATLLKNIFEIFAPTKKLLKGAVFVKSLLIFNFLYPISKPTIIKL